MILRVSGRCYMVSSVLNRLLPMPWRQWSELCGEPIYALRGRVLACERHTGHDGAHSAWVAIGAFAINTRDLVKAAKIAAKLGKRVKRSQQKGTLDGVRWMCLARFESLSKGVSRT